MTTTPQDKVDLLKLHKSEYAKPKKPALIDTTEAQYMVVDGAGEPGGDAFQKAMEALYGMAYTVKFGCKFSGRDFAVCKLEGLWGVGGDGKADMSDMTAADFKWQMLIRMPDFVTDEDLDNARAQLKEKGKEGDFDAVRLETLDEGQCVQMLHVGPYEDGQKTTVPEMQAFIEEQGLKRRLWHHEIYLSDPRRVAPEKLKTIIRLPVK